MGKRDGWAKKPDTRKLYLTYFLYRCQGLQIAEIAKKMGHKFDRVENGLWSIKKLYKARNNLHLLTMLITDGVFVIDNYILKLDYE